MRAVRRPAAEQLAVFARYGQQHSHLGAAGWASAPPTAGELLKRLVRGAEFEYQCEVAEHPRRRFPFTQRAFFNRDPNEDPDVLGFDGDDADSDTDDVTYLSAANVADYDDDGLL